MTREELEKIRDENSENYREGESCSFYMNEIEAYKEGFDCASELLINEIELLQAKLNAAEYALELISKTDVSTNPPDAFWLNNWRNTRKEIASKALAEIRKKDE